MAANLALTAEASGPAGHAGELVDRLLAQRP
jgi:3-carboxy-cis,cis-muconate cycloisomerase